MLYPIFCFLFAITFKERLFAYIGQVNYKLLLRRLENIIFFAFVLFLILYFLLQSQSIQNWLVNKATTKLKEDLKTEVSIGGAKLRFFDRVDLEKVYIEDTFGDTLIYVGQLEASLKGNFFSVLFQKIDFEEIELHDAQINLFRRKGEYDKSLKFLTDYFAPKKEKKEPDGPPSPFNMSIQNLVLNNVLFREHDAKAGRDYDILIHRGHMRMEYFDRVKNEILAPAVTINGFDFIFKEYTKTPLPERETITAQPPEAIQTTQNHDSVQIEPYIPEFLKFRITELDINNGFFKMDKNRKRPLRTAPDSVMDYDHMVVRDIALRVHDFYGDEDLVFGGDILHFQAKEDAGFHVKHGEANDVTLTDKKAILNDLLIETDNSSFGGHYEMHYQTYKDYRKFENKVEIRSQFRDNSEIGFRDIMYFSPPVNRNKFFISNKNRKALISGKIMGKVNNLKGRDLVLKIGSQGYLGGRFDFDDLFGGGVPRMAFFFDDLRTEMQTLRDLIPGFSAPTHFDRLGQIRTDSAHYNILFGTDHILGGRFKTDLGGGGLSMQLVLPEGGRDAAIYSGDLVVNDFDLKTWTGNENFDKTSFSIHLAESNGLSKSTVNARLKGTLKQLGFKGFSYENIYMNGQFNGPRFDGDLVSDSDELRFDFKGKVDFSDSLPDYSFEADVKRLDLKALQLIDKDWVVSGKVDYLDLEGNKLDNLQGGALIRDFHLLKDKDKAYSFDSLAFALNLDSLDYRQITARSEMVDMDMEGFFAPQRLESDLSYLFEKSFPEFAQNLGIKPDSASYQNIPLTYFDFKIDVKNTKSFLDLAGLGTDTLQNVGIEGKVDLRDETSSLKLLANNMKYGKLNVTDVDITWRQIQSRAFYSAYVGQSQFGKYTQGIIDVSGKFIDNELDFDILHQNANSALRSVSLRGTLSALENRQWLLNFEPSDIHLFSDVWKMAEDNSVTFGNGSFATSEFELFSRDNKRINLLSRGKRGLSLTATNFDLSFLDNFLKIKDVTYKGNISDVDIIIDDVFNLTGMELFLGIDSFTLKERTYGFFQANVSMADLKSPVLWTADIADMDADYALRALGGWLPGGSEVKPIFNIGQVAPKEFILQLDSRKFPLDIVEQFIPGISKMKGEMNGLVSLSGPFSQPNMDGLIYVDSASVQLDYLQTSFVINHQPIALNNFQIWAEGDTIYDVQGDNMAFVFGGLRHEHFKHWTIDCSIRSADNNFQIMDTKKGDNELFYGKGVGKVEARFTGSFSKTNMKIIATTGRGTELKLPLEDGGDADEISFIKFIKKTEDSTAVESNFTANDLKGIDLNIDLFITEDADIQIILDEKAGDIVKGKGVGFINMTYDRAATFKMQGDYTIRKGEYLFTLLNFINKPFTVEEGGTIKWFGDPYGAQINLKANYDVNASIYNFLQTELEAQANSDIIRQAQQGTKVVLNMGLTGALFTPDIKFGFTFPDIVGELKSLTENKLRLVRQDQNEVNRQVFGLVVLGAFLPSSDNGFIQGSSLAAPVVNTFTQFLTSQFSNYLTGLASEWFGGAVSSIAFDIAYNEYTNALSSDVSGAGTYGRELQVRLSSGFNNDRVIINFGSQFAIGGNSVPGTIVQDGFLGEDVTVEIALTANRQWRLKVYQKLEPDITGGAFRWRFGGGLAFQKDYDSFEGMMKGLGKRIRKKS